MTTLENRPNTALLVIDVQNGVVAGNHERDAVVANVGSLVDKARQERVPVVWVQHSDEHLARGSDDWWIVPELKPGDTEPLVEKNYGDSFEDTTLGVHQGIRRDPGQRRPHDRGPDGMGGAAAGAGHRAHKPVLDLPDGAGAHRRDGRDQGRGLRRHVLKRRWQAPRGRLAWQYGEISGWTGRPVPTPPVR